jgi:hypothetical protein
MATMSDIFNHELYGLFYLNGYAGVGEYEYESGSLSDLNPERNRTRGPTTAHIRMNHYNIILRMYVRRWLRLSRCKLWPIKSFLHSMCCQWPKPILCPYKYPSSSNFPFGVAPTTLFSSVVELKKLRIDSRRNLVGLRNYLRVNTSWQVHLIM